MFPSVIIVDIAVGTLAALLTTLEYFLSALSALSIRAALHGFWLLGLHRGGRASIDTQTRLRRSNRKDIVSAIIGIWLVVGVALVESNLQVGIQMSPSPTNSTECVSVYGKYRADRVYMNVPPYHTTVEPWILRVASMLECGNAGIATIGVGDSSDASGVRRNMSAPVCDHTAVGIASGEVAINISSLRVERELFKSDKDRTSAIILFPDDADNLGKDNSRIKREGSGVCGQNGISNFFYGSLFKAETVFMSGMNMSFGLHEYICALHGSTSKHVLPKYQADACVTRGKGILNVTCIRNGLSPAQIHSTMLEKVSALFVGGGIGAMSYACPWAKVLQEYTFIDPTVIKEVVPDTKASLPVLLVLSARAIDGYCERTIGLLGQAALLYSADAVWRNDDLATMEPRKRYYAYLMAVSSSQFPLNKIGGDESPMGNDGCFVREVEAVTEIPVDWRLWILFCGLMCVTIVMIIGAGFRLVYTGESWEVGSAQWSLRRLLEEERKESKALVEVVEVGGGDESVPVLQRLYLPTRRISKQNVEQEDRQRTAERYVYRVRTIRDWNTTAGDAVTQGENL